MLTSTELSPKLQTDYPYLIIQDLRTGPRPLFLCGLTKSKCVAPRSTITIYTDTSQTGIVIIDLPKMMVSRCAGCPIVYRSTILETYFPYLSR